MLRFRIIVGVMQVPEHLDILFIASITEAFLATISLGVGVTQWSSLLDSDSLSMSAHVSSISFGLLWLLEYLTISGSLGVNLMLYFSSCSFSSEGSNV